MPVARPQMLKEKRRSVHPKSPGPSSSLEEAAEETEAQRYPKRRLLPASAQSSRFLSLSSLPAGTLLILFHPGGGWAQRAPRGLDNSRREPNSEKGAKRKRQPDRRLDVAGGSREEKPGHGWRGLAAWRGRWAAA